MEKLRVTIVVQVTEGRYSYKHLADQEVTLVGSADGLASLNVAGLVADLYQKTLAQAIVPKEEEDDGTED